MKKFIIVLSIMLLSCVKTYSQSISCEKVFEIVTTQYDSKEDISCYGSTMLVKAEYYKLDNKGYVVAYIRKNTYDFKGSPYIFCDIPSMNWATFKYNAKSSWGESFHAYISDYKCNCN